MKSFRQKKFYFILQNDYALRKLYMFVNMCERNVPQEVIEAAIMRVCVYEN